MPDDFDSRIDSLATKAPSTGDDFDSRIDSLASNKDTSFVGRASRAINRVGPAFASNVMPGLAEIPEQLINAGQYASRNMHPLLNPQAQLMPSLSPVIDPLNQAFGAPAQPYLDITGALKNRPIPSYGNQTPNQLSQQQPIAGAVGNMVGQAPFFMAGGEAAGLSKLPLALRVGKSALGFGGFNAAVGGTQEASNEIKSNDAINPQQVGQAAYDSFNQGAVLGGLGGLFTKGMTPEVAAELKRIGYNYPQIEMKKGPFYPPARPIMPVAKVPKGIEMQPIVPQSPAQRAAELRGEAAYTQQHPGSYVQPAAPTQPEIKRIGRGAIEPPGPAEQARMRNELYVPPFRHVESVHGEVIKPQELKAEAGALSGKTVKIGYGKDKPVKQPKSKPAKEAPTIVIRSEPTPPSDAIEARVEKLVDPDKSWRGVREDKARPATAQETPIARDLARNKVHLDAARAKLRGAIRQMYKLLGLDVPKRPNNIDPKLADELTQIAKDLGGESTKRAYVETVLSPNDKFPEVYDFKGTTLAEKMHEIRDLDKDFKSKESKYENFKENHEEELSETLTVNEPVQVSVDVKEYGHPRSVNVTSVWRATEYEFKTPEGKIDEAKTAQYQKARAERQAKSQKVDEVGTPTFKSVISQVADRGDHLQIEGLADAGALDWFKKKPKGTQAKIVVAIAVAASIMAGNNQEAEAAPPRMALVGNAVKNSYQGLVAKVVKQLFQGGWKETMGSRPITRILQLEMTSDMIKKGFDATSKAFANKRFHYLQQLKRANIGSRPMTDAEKMATKDMQPWELRRTPALEGWTQMQKNKAGDILYLHQQYREQLKIEKQRIAGLGVKPGHWGAAQRYNRGLDFDAKKMGLGLNYDPAGGSNQFFNKISGEIMQTEFTGNYRVMGLHVLEAVTASLSKWGVQNFSQALHGIATSNTYREFAKDNAHKGFFQQRLESQSGFGYRQAVTKWINDPIDKFIKSLPNGEIIDQALKAQLGERGKLGLNAVVIAQALAKDYPGGPEAYMRDWLNNANHRIPVPAYKQMEFSKIATKAAIEENIATASLPHGLLFEDSVMQRNKWLGILEPFSYGKLVQSRFCLSLADDFLEAAAKGDKAGMLSAAKAGLLSSLMIGAVSGSHAVSPFVWAALEQVNDSVYGTTKDIEALKANIDALQKNIGPGYQIQKYGVTGLAFTRFPSTAVGDMWDRLVRDAKPKTKMDIMRCVFDFATAAFISRIGPWGTLNLDYMLERIGRGLKGYEQFKQYESSPQGTLMDKVQGRPFATRTVDKKLPFDIAQGVLHAFVDIENPLEVKAIQQADHQASKNWHTDTRSYGKSWGTALKH